jgi:hypothetical protein
MMKLYGFGPTRSLRALWGLKELGLEFEFIPVNLQAGEHRRPEFLALNPAGKVPVLVDGELVLTESADRPVPCREIPREKADADRAGAAGTGLSLGPVCDD